MTKLDLHTIHFRGMSPLHPDLTKDAHYIFQSNLEAGGLSCMNLTAVLPP